MSNFCASVRLGAGKIHGDAEVLRGVFRGGLVVGGGAASGVAAVLLAAGVAIAAAHDDDDNPAAAREPLRLRKKRPGRDFGMLLGFARGAVRHDNERMLAGQVGIDEQSVEAIGCGLGPRDEDFALDIVRRGGGLRSGAEADEKEQQRAAVAHRKTVQRLPVGKLSSGFGDDCAGFGSVGRVVAGEDGDDLGEGDEEG